MANTTTYPSNEYQYISHISNSSIYRENSIPTFNTCLPAIFMIDDGSIRLSRNYFPVLVMPCRLTVHYNSHTIHTYDRKCKFTLNGTECFLQEYT